MSESKDATIAALRAEIATLKQIAADERQSRRAGAELAANEAGERARLESPPRADGGGLVAYLLHCVACGSCGWRFKGARPLPDCPEGLRLAAAVPPLDEAPIVCSRCQRGEPCAESDRLRVPLDGAPAPCGHADCDEVSAVDCNGPAPVAAPAAPTFASKYHCGSCGETSEYAAMAHEPDGYPVDRCPRCGELGNICALLVENADLDDLADDILRAAKLDDGRAVVMALLRRLVVDTGDAPAAPAPTCFTRTFCPACGPGVRIDEDGCCATCGATATGEAVEALPAAVFGVAKASP